MQPEESIKTDLGLNHRQALVKYVAYTSLSLIFYLWDTTDLLVPSLLSRRPVSFSTQILVCLVHKILCEMHRKE